MANHSIKKAGFPSKYGNFREELFEPKYEQPERRNGDLEDKYNARYNDNYPSLDASAELLHAILDEQECAVKHLYDLYVTEAFTPQRGVLIGTGEVSPHNVGLHLQQPHGLPYLPGSSIQGMVRSYIITNFFDKKEKMALQDVGFRQIFGSGPEEDEKHSDTTLHSRGRVDFLDAYPTTVSSGMVKREVFTNHFQDYYMDESGDRQPTDDMWPNPVSYLTIANTSFRVYTGILRKDQNKPITGGRFDGFPPLVVVNRYLHLAFADAGVGARTKNNWGHGIFAPKNYRERVSDDKLLKE